MRLPGRASRQVYRVYEEDEYLAATEGPGVGWESANEAIVGGSSAPETQTIDEAIATEAPIVGAPTASRAPTVHEATLSEVPVVGRTTAAGTPIVGEAGSPRGLLALCLLVAAVLSVAAVVLVNAIRSTTGSRQAAAARSVSVTSDTKAADGMRLERSPARSRRLLGGAPRALARSTGVGPEPRLGGAAGAPTRRPIHIDLLDSAHPASPTEGAPSERAWPTSATPAEGAISAWPTSASSFAVARVTMHAEPALREFGFER